MPVGWHSRSSRAPADAGPGRRTRGQPVRKHAALAGGDHLARMEREGRRVRECEPIGRPSVRRPERAGGVLDDGDAASSQTSATASMSAGRPHWWTRMTARVAGVRAAFDGLGGQVLRLGVDVGEHRRGAHVADDVGGGDEGQRRHDDLVAGTDTEKHEGRRGVRRCRLERATPVGRSAVRSDTACSNAATRGPCATHPEATASAAAAASSSPSQGRITGMTGLSLESAVGSGASARGCAVTAARALLSAG